MVYQARNRHSVHGAADIFALAGTLPGTSIFQSHVNAMSQETLHQRKVPGNTPSSRLRRHKWTEFEDARLKAAVQVRNITFGVFLTLLQ